jgi:branched-chain amino acid transport system permease protein
MDNSSKLDLRQIIRSGLIAGLLTVIVSAIGLVDLFGQRALVANLVTMGQVIIYTPVLLITYLAIREFERHDYGPVILTGALTGIASSVLVAGFILLASSFNLREFLPNVSPATIELLSFGQGASLGSLLQVAAMGTMGLVTALYYMLPDRFQRPLFNAVLWTLIVGLFSEILSNRLRDFFGSAFSRLIFTGKALNGISAAILFLLIGGVTFALGRRDQTIREQIASLPPNQQRIYRIGAVVAGIALLLVLPALLGTYLSEVMNNVGIYILMGLGLNIVVGFAGLLDLGYVAFFAIGAYSMAILTSQGSLGIGGLTFWTALPFSVLMAAIAGVVLGVPVLRMRGDYLAIVTLGFGEIIRILALSDMLKPYIGGAQGVLQIPKPPFLGGALVQPGQFYYIVLAGCLLAWFVSWRLSEARLGRQWMALREDEDVAEAMGIRLVATKLLAFGFGAAFSGLAGALFASKLTSIFPHSFKLEISINVLSLIIIGGMGSLPGVVVGALILVGLPELLREFAEYRLLMYGALLVVMMLAKPEGFWPSAVRRRELHADEQIEGAIQSSLAESGD